MRCLTRDEFLTADDLPLTPVKLPGVYGDDAWFYIRTMTGTERAEVERQHFADGDTPKDDPGKFRSTLLILCVVDKDGKQIFKKEDADKLLSKACTGIEAMVDVALRLNGFTKDDVDQIEKN